MIQHCYPWRAWVSWKVGDSELTTSVVAVSSKVIRVRYLSSRQRFTVMVQWGPGKSPLTGPSVDGTDGHHKITAREKVGLPNGPSIKPRFTANWALSPERLVHNVRFSLVPDHFRMKVLTIPNDRTADMCCLDSSAHGRVSRGLLVMILFQVKPRTDPTCC